MANILDDDKKRGILASGRLGWALRRSDWATGVRRATVSAYLKGRGLLSPGRADAGVGLLFEPPTGPLSSAHPGIRFRDRHRYPQCASHTRKELQYDA